MQQEHISTLPDNIEAFDDLYCYPVNRIWISDAATILQIRIRVIGHSGASWHRGQKKTEEAICECFHWSTASDDVRSFASSCIHCFYAQRGEKVPRLFGPARYGTKPDDLLQFDYIKVGPSTDGDKYVPLLRDDHSGYSWLFLFSETTALNAAQAIIDWCTAFGISKSFMSKGPAHFKNEIIRIITKRLKVHHHFTLLCCPWSNGSFERLRKDIVRVFRSALS